MVFVNTKAFVERVARALERAGYRVGVLSGDVPQKKRESLLKKFQAGQLEILVATDVAARGLHIDGVSHVYNYDLPFDAEDYVHRIGRTARLGAEGDAISFACERYAMGLPDIEAYIEQKIPSAPVTAELLTALPRKPREGVELVAEEGESIGEIFREAREQRAADDARRGVKPGGRGRGGAPRDGARGAAGEGRRERGPRPPRPPRAEASDAPAAAQPAEPAPAPDAQRPIDPVTGEPARAPRKRRRRRGGRRVEGGEATPAQANASAPAPAQRGPRHVAAVPAAARQKPAPAAPAAAKQDSPSLIARIGHGLKKLVTRAPRTQH
jgi:ATP-dependent RNA helicase RhlB